ncbi:putative cyclic AMP receptor-like protein A [Amylocarpus encephaloides]|uniref:Cyclic AMP receptor-like protein A n=1 Tax=Amylocarpus encephaloides TaxID=45428 RepID=A0A9P7YTD3_9HELO|nr:putative cyclic AMP receptor-like protein A [Amylocarpus encephaloides]
MKPSDLSHQDLKNFESIERISSSLSLIGIFFIVITYAISTSFHKPINRLVFYASVGNIFTNIATLMSRKHLSFPNSPICQFQAFLIQMFMPADAYWTLAMACNVWLTFYRKYDKTQLRNLEKYYIILCYGIPLIPAIAFLFVQTAGKGHMYGNATLWCWISTSYDAFRIGLFYGLVWFAIILTMIIYLRAGKDIWAKRKQLRNFAVTSSQARAAQDPFTTEGIHRKTDITVHYDDCSPVETVFPGQDDPGKLRCPAPTKSNNAFTVDISSAPAQPGDAVDATEKTDRRHAGSSSVAPIPPPKPYETVNSPKKYSAAEANTAIWSYAKVSFLFFVAMMVTWIPSSANRVYSVVHPGQISVGLAYSSALVLPLQGFWNATIYATTSLSACRELWGNIKAGQPFRECELGTLSWNRRRQRSSEDREHFGRLRSAPNSPPSKKRFFAENESETELQSSRPNTQGSSTRS